MTNYDFKALNAWEFEVLCLRLLRKHLHFDFRAFTTGRDGGIDLRYSTTDNQNECIVQAKHYPSSTFSNLQSHLKREEMPKVALLAPARYILTTSMSLTAKNIFDLQVLMKPYILNLSDIFDQTSLNQLISEHQEIELEFFKLWLSNTTMLKNVLHQDVWNNSWALKNEIQSSLDSYVTVKSHSLALSVLEKNNALIILGNPGIGKSTLAKVLALQICKKHNATLIEINDIARDMAAIDLATDARQVLYFDDFLGASIRDLKIPENMGAALSKFIRRIKLSKNKYLIMTSRTIVSNAVGTILKHHVNNDFFDDEQIVLELEDYSRLDKAMILRNHLALSRFKSDLWPIIKAEKLYREIVDHENYSPRIITYLCNTLPGEIGNLDSYKSKAVEALNNPMQIWANIFEYQISGFDRIILGVLLSFDGQAELPELKESLNSYAQKYPAELYHTTLDTLPDRLNTLSSSLIEIHLSKDLDPSQSEISIANPSISDYLVRRYDANPNQLKSIFLSITQAYQFTNLYRFFSTHPIIDSIRQERALLDQINNWLSEQETQDLSGRAIVSRCFIALQILPQSIALEVIAMNLSLGKLLEISASSPVESVKLLSYFNKDLAIYEVILFNASKFISAFLSQLRTDGTIKSAITFCEQYNLSLQNYLLENRKLVIDLLRDYLTNHLDDMIKGSSGYTYSQIGLFDRDELYDVHYKLDNFLPEEAQELINEVIIQSGLSEDIGIDESSLNIDYDGIRDALERDHLDSMFNDYGVTDYEGPESDDHDIDELFM